VVKWGGGCGGGGGGGGGGMVVLGYFLKKGVTNLLDGPEVEIVNRRRRAKGTKFSH